MKETPRQKNLEAEELKEYTQDCINRLKRAYGYKEDKARVKILESKALKTTLQVELLINSQIFFLADHCSLKDLQYVYATEKGLTFQFIKTVGA